MFHNIVILYSYKISTGKSVTLKPIKKEIIMITADNLIPKTYKQKPAIKSNKIPGVLIDRNSGKWHARFYKDGVRSHLGFFVEKWDAICARKSMESKHPKLITNCPGVNWCKVKKKYRVSIYINKKQKNLGSFDDYFEACCCRKSAECKHSYHLNHGRG